MLLLLHSLLAARRLQLPARTNPSPHAPVPCPPFHLHSGHAAALAGGTTMHIDFALPINHDLLAGWEEWQKKAEVGGLRLSGLKCRGSCCSKSHS